MSDTETGPNPRPTINLTSEGLDYDPDSDTFFTAAHPDQTLGSEGGSAVYTTGDEDADEDQDHGDFEDDDDEGGDGTPAVKMT
jgi:hypothetical protein